MTLEELHDLTTALLNDAGVSIEGLRRDSGELLAGLNNEQFLLAIRFLAGEEVSYDAVQLVNPEPEPRRRREPVEITEDEMAERLAKLEELDEETPAGPVDIGDGITLL